MNTAGAQIQKHGNTIKSPYLLQVAGQKEDDGVWGGSLKIANTTILFYLMEIKK